MYYMCGSSWIKVCWANTHAYISKIDCVLAVMPFKVQTSKYNITGLHCEFGKVALYFSSLEIVILIVKYNKQLMDIKV